MSVAVLDLSPSCALGRLGYGVSEVRQRQHLVFLRPTGKLVGEPDSEFSLHVFDIIDLEVIVAGGSTASAGHQHQTRAQQEAQPGQAVHCLRLHGLLENG